MMLVGQRYPEWHRMADDTGLGYEGGAVVFAAGLAVLAAAYYWTNVSRVFLFWAAFIFSRPLGATVGDLRLAAARATAIICSRSSSR